MNEITQVLHAIDAGDTYAAGQLFIRRFAPRGPMRCSSASSKRRRGRSGRSTTRFPLGCATSLKLHAKKPEDRFQSAKEVAELLGQRLADVQAGRAIEGRAEGRKAPGEAPANEIINRPLTRLGSPWRRRVLAWATVVLVLFGVTWLVSSIIQYAASQPNVGFLPEPSMRAVVVL